MYVIHSGLLFSGYSVHQDVLVCNPIQNIVQVVNFTVKYVKFRFSTATNLFIPRSFRLLQVFQEPFGITGARFF